MKHHYLGIVRTEISRSSSREKDQGCTSSETDTDTDSLSKDCNYATSMAFYLQTLVGSITSSARCYTLTSRNSATIVKFTSHTVTTISFCDRASMRLTRNSLPALTWCARPVLLQPFVQLRGEYSTYLQPLARSTRHSVLRGHDMWNNSTRTFAAKATAVDTGKQPALEQELSVNALSTQVLCCPNAFDSRC